MDCRNKLWMLLPGIISLFFHGSSLIGAPNPPETGHLTEQGRFLLRNYSPGEYGAHPENWAIVQDKRGIIYVGNNWGILEYDGVNWRFIPTPGNIAALSLSVGDNGTVYVGLENDFGYLGPDSIGQMSYISLSHLIPGSEKKVNDVWKVHATGDGVYFVTINHLYRYRIGKIRSWKITISALSTVIDDTLYFGQWEAGIMRLIQDSLHILPGSEQFSRLQNYLMLPLPGKSGKLFATREQGLYLYRNGIFTSLASPASAFLKQNLLYSYAELPGNRLALGTIRGGLLIIDNTGQVLHKVDAQQGLPDQTVVDAYPDRDGSLWLAQLNGISRIDLSCNITHFTQEDGLQSSILAIERHQGQLYAATQRGVYVLQAGERLGSPRRFQPVEGINSFAWGLHSTGNTLFAGTDKGIYRIANGKATQLDAYPYRVYDFQPSNLHSDRLYMALQRGVGILEKQNNRWVYRGRIVGFDEEMINLLVEEQDGIWMGSNALGVARVDSIRISPKSDGGVTGRVKWYDTSAGLPEGEVRPVRIAGKAFFTTEQGVYQFDPINDRFEPYPELNPFCEATAWHVSRIVEAPEGNIWLSAVQKGLPLNKERRVVRGTLLPGGGYRWNFGDYQRIANSGAINCIYPEADGVVWFGSTEGIFRYREPETKESPSGFRTLLRRVTVAGDSLIYAGAASDFSRTGDPVHKFRYSHNAIRFEFAATHFHDVEANQYQYVLVGFDRAWSPWSSEVKKDYTNLPEGNYRFRVRARNVYGAKGMETAFAFIILPPWYRTWWAYVLYIMGVLMAFGGLVGWQIRRLQKRSEEKIEREREKAHLQEANLRAAAAELKTRAMEAEKEVEKQAIRSRISSDLHDEIGSNLSSIAISLQMLQSKKQLGESERRRLKEMYLVVQQSAQAMREIVWFVNPENDSLEKLFAKMRSTANFMLDNLDFSFEVPENTRFEDIELTFRRNLFLIFKECLNNIVKHARATHITISLLQSDGMFIMEVTDNGRGFDPHTCAEGNGLNNIRKRAADMNGSLQLTSAPGKGTVVRFTVPLRGEATGHNEQGNTLPSNRSDEK